MKTRIIVKDKDRFQKRLDLLATAQKLRFAGMYEKAAELDKKAEQYLDSFYVIDEE